MRWRGASATRTSSACSALREQVRERLGALVGVEPAARRAHDVDDGRLQHRPRRPRRSARTTRSSPPPTSTRACSGRCTPAVRVSSWRAPEPDAILAAVTPRTRLIALSQVLWTTGRDAAGAGAQGADRAAGARGRRPVGRRDPGRGGRARLLHRSPARSGCAAPTPRARSWSPSPSGSGSRRPSYFAQASFEPDGASSRARARRGSTRTGSRRRPWRACSRRSRSTPEGRYERAAEQAAPLSRAAWRRTWSSCTATRRSSRSAPRTLRRSSRSSPSGTSWCARSRAPGLVRASCGWWTSDEDLERLVDGVRESS